jgi:hypothetical protein
MYRKPSHAPPRFHYQRPAVLVCHLVGPIPSPSSILGVTRKPSLGSPRWPCASVSQQRVHFLPAPNRGSGRLPGRGPRGVCRVPARRGAGRAAPGPGGAARRKRGAGRPAAERGRGAAACAVRGARGERGAALVCARRRRAAPLSQQSPPHAAGPALSSLAQAPPVSDSRPARVGDRGQGLFLLHGTRRFFLPRAGAGVPRARVPPGQLCLPGRGRGRLGQG